MLKWRRGLGSSSEPPETPPPKTPPPKDCVPQVNESLYQFHQPEGVPRMQVIFFHGLQNGDSSDAYLKTWESEDGSCLWPQLWLAEEFPHAHMLSVSYNGHVGKSSQESWDMYTIVENILYDLIEADIGQIPNCPLVFVGHCFGGLIMKQLCLRAIYMIGLTRFEKQRAKLKALLKNLKGMFFYGTPHHGNPCVDKLAKAMESPLLYYFKSLSKEAVRLNSGFNQLLKTYPLWRIRALGENLQTTSGLFRDLVPAPEESARHGDEFNVVPVDHVSICKPHAKIDRRFYALKDLFQEIETDLEDTHQCMGLPDYPIQVQRRAQDIIKILDRKRVLGIHGMGGIGKTTLAKEVFNTISRNFEYTCFLENVKGINNSELKSTLLRDFHCGGNTQKGIEWSKLREKHTLIVMDAVDTEDQVNVLPKLRHFGKKSRLIITSRDKNIFKSYDDCGSYEVEFLKDDDAMKLFCQHAFKQEKVPEDPTGSNILEENVKAIVDKCGGLPLTLEVMGRYLRGRERDYFMWEEARNKLRNVKPIDGAQNDRVWATLRLSYDALSHQEKEMFIDAGTIFFKAPLERALAAWRGAHGDSKASWENLVNRSMVKEVTVFDSKFYGRYTPCISEHKVVWVHEQLRDLATTLAKGYMVNVSSEAAMSEAMDLLDSKRMEASTKILRIYLSGSREDHKNCRSLLQLDALQNLKQLQYLDLNCVPHEGSVEGVTRNLSLLRWFDAVPRQGRPRRFSLPGWINFLEHSSQLLPISLKTMDKLAVLELADWAVSEEFVRELANSTTLVVLSLSRLHGLIDLPENFCLLSRLRELSLEKLDLPRLPESFGSLSALEKLEIASCELRTLPDSFGSGLRLLKDLRIRSCTLLKCLPDSFSQLSQLIFLIILDCGSLEALGTSFSHLPALECLHISDCDNLSSLPASFGDGLTSLKEVHIDGCESLKCLPDSFGNLSGLEELELKGLPLRTLPESFGNLSTLRKLRFEYCSDFSLPASFGCGLKSLKELLINSCNLLGYLPVSFYQLSGLERLQIQSCKGLVELGDSIGSLRALRYLSLENTGLRRLPESLWTLPALVEFDYIDESALEYNCIAQGGFEFDCKDESVFQLPLLWSLSQIEEVEIASDDRTSEETWGVLSGVLARSLACSGSAFPSPCFENFGQIHDITPEQTSEVQLLHSYRFPRSLRRLHLQPVMCLPESLGDLAELEVLHVTGTGLEALPTSMRNLSSLRTLQIECEDLKDLPCSLWELDVVEHLEISARLVESVPDGIGRLRSLRELDLSLRSITRLPDSIGELSSLQELTISAARLDSLPDTFGNLSSLQVLTINQSAVKSFPDTFGNLSCLQVLSIEAPSLQRLPSTFGNLSSLRRLTIRCGELESLPDTFGNLSSLQRLTIRCGELQSLPDTFGNLSSLQVLSSHCPLQELPDTFLQLQELEHISLINTFLRSVPNLDNLRSLKTLGLAWRYGARYPTLPECLRKVITPSNYTTFWNNFKNVDGNFVINDTGDIRDTW